MQRIAIPLVVALCLTLGLGLFSAGASAEPEIKGENGTCLDCHTNAGYLMQAVTPPPSAAEDSCAAAPSRPPFINVFVSPDFIDDPDHGTLGCTGCHGGDATQTDAARAHEGMIPGGGGCTECHDKIAKQYATSLHNTLDGMAHALKLRSGEKNFHKLDTMWQNDCATCHASCSDCHLTLPSAVGGGLIKGHTIFKRPPMKDTCAVCHGSRAGGEYLGNFAGVAPDVHLAEENMHCLDCHKNDLHGDANSYTNRWQVEKRPLCTDCHPALPNDKSKFHTDVHADVSCQVCHAQPYQNCFSCHSSMKDDHYLRKAGHKELLLRIGRNTQEGYGSFIVTLRNNPVAKHSFEYFGRDLLPHFEKYPTWKTAAPHNIVLQPAQSKTCESCHDNDDLFIEDLSVYR